MAQHQITADELEEYRKAFGFFDKNKSGSIDAEEIRSAMRSLGQDPNEEEVQSILKESDGNGDGTIEFDEFVAAMQKRSGKVAKKTSSPPLADSDILEAFETLDKDKDGFITEAEFKNCLAQLQLNQEFPDDLVDQMFMDADKDGDGRISFAEFTLAINEEK